MKTLTRGAVLAAAVVVALSSSATASLDTNAMAARYAAFKKQQAKKWLLPNALGTLGVSSAAVRLNQVSRFGIRTTGGHINPTNMPVFGSDVLARRAALDSQIHITGANSVSTGADVVVAVLDSGFNVNHPAISSRVLPYGYDSVGHDWNPQDRGNGVDDDLDGYTDDGVGHGTFVAGMVLAVAPDAWIIPVRIADDEGGGLAEELASGIDYAIAMQVDVINLSFETGLLTSGVTDKIEEAYDAGITVVVSVGNDESEQVNALAELGTTIGVGAVNDDDQIASWSNTPSDGEGLTLLAPGVDMWGPHGGPANDTNCTWSGTSFAAPLVAGAVALALELHPSLTPDEIRTLLRAASTTAVEDWDETTYEYAGRIDLLDIVSP